MAKALTINNHTVTQEIRDHLMPELLERYSRYQKIHTRRTGNTLTIKLMRAPDGRAQMTLNRNARGTVQARNCPWDGSHVHALNHAAHGLCQQVQEEIARWVERRYRGRITRHLLNNPIQALALAGQISQLAGDVVAQAVVAMEPAPEYNYEQRAQKNQEIYRRIKELFDPDLMAAVRKARSHQQPGYDRNAPCLDSYNNAVPSRPAFTAVMRDNPALARFALTSILPLDQYRQGFANPEEITRATRQTLGLSGPRWTIFARLGANPISPQVSRKDQIVNNATGAIPHEPDTIILNPDSIQALARAVETIHQANRPGADNASARHLIDQYRSTAVMAHNAAEQKAWTHGDPWRRWVQLAGQFLDQTDDKNIQNELRTIVDAFRYHLDNDLPWRPTDWPALVRRAERWHDQMNRKRSKEYLDSLRQANWDSLIADFQERLLTAQAVTNGFRLHQVALHMHNCLTSFVTRCQNGTARIFVLNSPRGEIEAAVELRRDSARTQDWQVGQIEKRGRLAPSSPHQTLARHLCRAYNEAQRQQTQNTSEEVQP